MHRIDSSYRPRNLGHAPSTDRATQFRRRIDLSPRLLPLDLEAQSVPGKFAHAVHQLVDALDQSAFDARYRDDDNGAPAMLLKAVLMAYSQEMVFLAPPRQSRDVCSSIHVDRRIAASGERQQRAQAARKRACTANERAVDAPSTLLLPAIARICCREKITSENP